MKQVVAQLEGLLDTARVYCGALHPNIDFFGVKTNAQR